MANNDSHPLIFFHVGLPKTASTFLQRKVFPYFNGIHFVKKHDFKKREKIIATTNQSKVLLSIELDLDSPDGANKVRDVANQHPDTKPIIVFRKHGSWVGSKYKYYLRKHGARSFDNYFNPDSNQGLLKDQNLQFYSKIKLLEEKYGSEPFVMFQEEFQNKPFKAIKALADFMGVDYDENNIKISTVKKSYSEHALYYVRKLNRLYKYDHSRFKTTFFRTFYKKINGGMLHLTAFFAGITEPEKSKAKKVLPQSAIDKINKEYADDWQKCIEYAKTTREVYL